ncbi:ATP synthase F0 subcomplex subunit H atp14 [Hypoxylon texense]
MSGSEGGFDLLRRATQAMMSKTLVFLRGTLLDRNGTGWMSRAPTAVLLAVWLSSTLVLLPSIPSYGYAEFILNKRHGHPAAPSSASFLAKSRP